MSLPKQVYEKARRVHDYIFAVMNFTSSISDDHFPVRDVLQFMGKDIIEDWEVVKDYLDRQEQKPLITSVSNLKED